MKQAHSRYWCAFLLLFVLLALLAAWNINAGSVPLTGAEILHILFSPPDGSTEYGIVRTLRLPRICAAVILGGGLSVSGFLLQTFLPIPSPAPLCWASPPEPSWRCPW